MQETFKVEEIKSLYNSATDHEKSVLERLFSEKINFKRPITERVRSFQDACEVLGITKSMPDVGYTPEMYKNTVLKFYKMLVITDALNEGWFPNWDDPNEPKYAICMQSLDFFDKDSFCIYETQTHYFNGTLYFHSKELAEYFVFMFKNLHYEY